MSLLQSVKRELLRVSNRAATVFSAPFLTQNPSSISLLSVVTVGITRSLHQCKSHQHAFKPSSSHPTVRTSNYLPQITSSTVLYHRRTRPFGPMRQRLHVQASCFVSSSRHPVSGPGHGSIPRNWYAGIYAAFGNPGCKSERRLEGLRVCL
jgi:hypothetical protein